MKRVKLEYGSEITIADEAFEQISAMVKGNRVCDEQPAVRQHSHCIRQVVMGFALKDIADGEGGWDYSVRAPSQMAAFPVHLAQKAGVSSTAPHCL